MKIRAALAALVLSVTGLSLNITTCMASEEYIRVKDYLTLYPEQAARMEQLSDRVHNPAITLQNSQQRPARIAVLYPGLQSSDYWRRSLRSFEHRLQQIGLKYQLKTFLSRPSVDAALQSQQLNEALQWQPDYLVFTLETVRQRRLIEQILAKGTPKLILQNITTPLTNWQSHKPFLYVGFDHAQGTRLLADWMLEKVGYEADYLMLYFSPGYISKMRGDTFATEAARYPAVQQVAQYFTNGNRTKAYKATKRALEKHPGISMIYANSTDIALGALQALKEQGLADKVLLNGWGGGSNELAELRTKDLDVTVMRMNDDNGVAMAEAIAMDIDGDGNQVPHIFAGDIRLLHSSTSDAEIDQLKQQAFRFSDLDPQPVSGAD
ncbi:MAG: substrate-binding domain-containing protein [Marinobacterium sp.]|nr:substrate-binding domain-containing protein [Marinobacterium sp.]